MEQTQQIRVTFLGLGLIGGSLARALKEKRGAVTILAYDVQKPALDMAIRDGIADEIYYELDKDSAPRLADADYLFFSAPVECNNENMERILPYLHKDTILTDVGSVKTSIHEQVKALGLNDSFIGGHPMAGTERIGYQNSKAGLFENAYYILTPGMARDDERLERMVELARSIGALPLILDYKEHDYIVGAVSHLPHVIASSLVNLVKDSDNEEGIMKLVAAGGFKDITRIASSSSVMWQQICLTNSENIVRLLDRYMDSLAAIRDEIRSADSGAIYEFFSSARVYRDSFIDASSGPIKRVYSLNVEIPDEAGSLASVATLLALNNISIKNIGITHNRESEDGVLRIEFYVPEAIDQAVKLLTARGYTVFKRT